MIEILLYTIGWILFGWISGAFIQSFDEKEDITLAEMFTFAYLTPALFGPLIWLVYIFYRIGTSRWFPRLWERMEEIVIFKSRKK